MPTRVETLHSVQLLGYEMDNRRIAVRFPSWEMNFSLRGGVETGFGTHPASHPICTGRSFVYVKRLGDETDLSPQSSAEVMNEWSYTSIPACSFMSCTWTTLLQFTYFPSLYSMLLCWSMCDKDVNIPDVGRRFALICLYYILLHKRWILTHRYKYRRYKLLRMLYSTTNYVDLHCHCCLMAYDMSRVKTEKSLPLCSSGTTTHGLCLCVCVCVCMYIFIRHFFIYTRLINSTESLLSYTIFHILFHFLFYLP